MLWIVSLAFAILAMVAPQGLPAAPPCFAMAGDAVAPASGTAIRGARDGSDVGDRETASAPRVVDVPPTTEAGSLPCPEREVTGVVGVCAARVRRRSRTDWRA